MLLIDGELRVEVGADGTSCVVERRRGGERYICALHAGRGRIGVLVEQVGTGYRQRATGVHQAGGVVDRRAIHRHIAVGGDLTAGVGEGAGIDRQRTVGNQLALVVGQGLALHVQRGVR